MCRFLNYDGTCRCKCLTRGGAFICPGTPCTLAQTEAQQVKSLHKAWARFTALPVATQHFYSNLYYDGKMPWEVNST